MHALTNIYTVVLDYSHTVTYFDIVLVTQTTITQRWQERTVRGLIGEREGREEREGDKKKEGQ